MSNRTIRVSVPDLGFARPTRTATVVAAACLGAALLAASARPAIAAPAAERLASGTVTASRARWSGGSIVTESVIRGVDGSEIATRQLGGTVDGIGMRIIPGPPLLQVGERVTVRLDRSSPRAWTVRAVDYLTARPPAGPAATGLDQPAPTAAPIGELPPLGFVRTVNATGAQLHWSSGCVFITYDGAGTSHLAGDQEFLLMDAALQNWRSSTESCAYIQFVAEPRTTDVEVGYDRVNLMKFRDTRWCRPATDEDPEECYDPSAAALTTLYFVEDEDSSRNGELLDADIELNGVNFSISYLGSSLGTPPCMSDLPNTFTHEVGHVLGLDHTCWTGTGEHPVDGDGNPVPSCGQALPPLVTEATMFTYQECGEQKKATLEADDIAGICEIYPLADDPGECKRVDPNNGGCCAVGPGRRQPDGGAGPLLLGFLVLLATRRRSAVSGRHRAEPYPRPTSH